jgi:hypothetical protein
MPVISPDPFHYWRSLPHRPERVERPMSRSIIRTLRTPPAGMLAQVRCQSWVYFRPQHDTRGSSGDAGNGRDVHRIGPPVLRQVEPGIAAHQREMTATGEMDVMRLAAGHLVWALGARQSLIVASG